MAHPAIVPLFMAHRHVSTAVQRCAEAFLRALTEAGFRGRRRVPPEQEFRGGLLIVLDGLAGQCAQRRN